MKSLKILYVIDKMTVGGAQRHLAQVMRALPGAGGEPYLAALDGLGPMADGLPSERITAFGLQRMYGARALAALPGVVRWIRRGAFDVAHTYLFSANCYASLAARLAGVPLILTSRRGPEPENPWYYWPALEFTQAWTDGVVVNSDELVRYTADRENCQQSRIHRIYNGIEAVPLDVAMRTRCRQEWGFSPETVVIGLVAKFRPLKDHATALQAAAIVRRRHPEARFVFVGDGETRAAMEQLAADLHIADSCCFTGERQELTSLTQAFDIAIFTTRSEGFSNAVLEAMMAGLPVVTTPVGGNAEAVIDGKTGFHVPMGDASAAAERLGRLIDDASLRRRMGEAARRRALEEFGVESMVAAMMALYRSLLAEKLPAVYSA